MQFKKAIYLHGRNLRLVVWYKMKSKSPSDILSYSVHIFRGSTKYSVIPH